MPDRTGFVGLLKIELLAPDGSVWTTVRLCDGGFMSWGAETFTSADPVFGSIGAVDPLDEGIDESVPAFDMTLLPPGTAAPEELSQPGFQRSRVQFWLAEFDPDLGTLIGDPEPMFDGQIDRTTLVAGRGELRLEMSVVSNLERLFTRNRGNSLNPRWHKSVWAGETGHDNATGLAVPVAWGAENRGGANGSSGVGGSGGSGGGRGFEFSGVDFR